MMDHSNPADWVYVLALIQLFGLKYLMAASDGWHYVSIQTKKRWLALWAGLTIIWIPYLLVWIFAGHSPLDMWNGAIAWWQAGIPVGYAVAIIEWWLLLSPVHALIAAALTWRATQREKEMMALLHYGMPS